MMARPQTAPSLSQEEELAPYDRIYRAVCNWIKDGKFEYIGNTHAVQYTPLDDIILEAFGYEKSYDGIMRFNNENYNKEEDFAWLFGPYGAVLFKAKMKQKV